MGIDPFRLATTVNVIQAQRLARRICSRCKVDVTAEVSSQTLVEIGFPPEQVGNFSVMRGRGCQTCNGTGYKGRVGLFEVMQITEGIRDLILVGATGLEIARKALEEGMLTLRMSGLEKIRAGVTTVEEVCRETVLGVGGWMPRTLPREVPAPERSRRRPVDPSPAPGPSDGRRKRPPSVSSERIENPRAAPSRDVELEIVRLLGLDAEDLSSNIESGSLAVQLETAYGELHCLRQRLFELNCSDIQTVQLANAKTEIDALRQRLFELHSYKIAYECLRDERSRPPMGSH
jgi:hypothetical protein